MDFLTPKFVEMFHGFIKVIISWFYKSYNSLKTEVALLSQRVSQLLFLLLTHQVKGTLAQTFTLDSQAVIFNSCFKFCLTGSDFSLELLDFVLREVSSL